VLRSTGAGPRTVFGLLFIESALVMWVGVASGVLVLVLGSAALAPWVQAQFGLQLVGLGELGVGLLAALAFAAFGSLLGLVPAFQAYRNQLQDGLNPKTN
jgi:putative ABC transport system permease protein